MVHCLDARARRVDKMRPEQDQSTNFLTQENEMKEVRTFAMQKTTKNTVQYMEVAAAGKPQVIGTLYVQKAALEGEPAEITVTVEAK